MIRIEPQSRLKEFTGSLRALAAGLPVEQCRAPHGQTDDFRITRSFAQSTMALGVDKNDVQRTRYALSDLILHFCKHGQFAIETVRPQLRGICGVDKLCIDAHGIRNPAHTTLHRIAYRQFTADLPNIGWLSLVGEGRAWSDHQ